MVENGTCGEDLTWTLDSEGTLIISGSGMMESRAFEEKSSIVTVEIKSGVTSIGS